MPLLTCPECNGSVSTAAPACPRCGFPFERAAEAASVVPAVAVPVPSEPSATHLATHYAPRMPELKIRRVAVMVSLVLIGAGLYFALSWIPEHDITQVRTVRHFTNSAVRQTEYLKPEQVQTATIGAWTCTLLGVAQLLTRSLKRSGRLGYCGGCDLTVYARRRFTGFECERCGGRFRK